MAQYLPGDVMEIILLKTPYRFRFRFEAVSKEWNKLLTDIRHKPTNLKHFLVGCSSVRTKFAFNLDCNDSIVEFARFKCPGALFRMTGFGNGLIMFSNYDEDILWNPLAGTRLTLPKVTGGSTRDARCAFGIVADQNRDCKILRLDLNSNIHILRLSTGTWELLAHPRPFNKMFIGQVDLEGRSYWIGQNAELKTLLVSFDGNTETFSVVTLPLPDLSQNKIFVAGEHYTRQVLYSFGESLFFIHGTDYAGDDNENYVFSCQIWKRVDTEGQNWELGCTVSFKKHVIPLGFRENGEFLWAERSINKLISTDMKNGSRRKGNRSTSTDVKNGLRSKGNKSISTNIKNGLRLKGPQLISTNLKTGLHTCIGTHTAEEILSYPSYVENLPPLETTRKTRNRRPPSYLADYEVYQNHNLPHDDPDLRQQLERWSSMR